MKQIFLYLTILILALPELVQASHYMGGEITWECMTGANYTTAQQGRYRFHMKLYRECYSTTPGGSAATFGTSETMSTTVPGLASISMSIKSGWPKDISPSCINYALSIKCVGASAPNNVANSGAMQEYYYTSDGSYPNGVQLTGVPPATGWMFYQESCCRNPCTNITNATSLGFRLRAIMYPYNNQNVYPCFDNSPTFAESPKPIMCAGYPILYNHNATDKENDSLSFEWGQPLNSGNSPITSYSVGYSYLNPLPGLSQNPNNIPASINPSTGEISLTSFSNGAFVTSTKVSAFKDGQKISEIWRDVQLVLKDCDTVSKPTVVFTSTYSSNLIKNVIVGDTVDVNIFSMDSSLNPNIRNWAIGSQFGTFVPSNGSVAAKYDTIGCAYTPCAGLNNAGSLYNPDTVNGNISNFHWVTSSNHLSSGSQSSSYTFQFFIKNGMCPIPIYNTAKLIVNISSPYLITSKPKILSTEVMNSFGDLKIMFSIPSDPDSAFNTYEFFTSSSINGPFVYAGSSNNYSNNVFIHRNPSVINNSVYYYMRVKDVKNGLTIYSSNSDKVLTDFVDLSIESVNYLHTVGGNTDVRMEVKNYGNNPISNFTLRYDIIGGSFNSALFTYPLLPGQTYTYQFPSIIAYDSGNVTICGSVLHQKDFNVVNNMYCAQAYTSIESIFEKGFKLSQNIPNPTKGKTQIQFEIPMNGEVTFEIKNIIGQSVFTQKQKYSLGEHSIDIDLSTYQEGIYFYTIEMMGFKTSRRLILIK